MRAVLVGSLLAMLWASPAHAFSDQVFLEAPAPGGTAAGSETIKVEAKPAHVLGIGLEEVTIRVTVSPRSGTGGEPVSLGEQTGGTFQGTWNAGAASFNGAYDIQATATSGSSSKNASVNNVLVNNRPAAPTGVKATLKDGVPVISWNANPEKDITGYKVLRSVDGGAFNQVFAGPATSANDTAAPHSKALTYKVSAVRKSPVTPAGIEALSGPTAAVTIPAPPPPADAPAAGASAGPDKPVVPGTNIVTGKETPKASVPITNRNFGKAVAPIVKPAPAGAEFNETLPYSGVPPEQFEAAGGGDPSPLDAGGSQTAQDAVTVTNPLKFIIGGILLLIASAFMWRTSRRMLKSTKVADPKLPVVKYPSLRINRS